MTRASIVHNIVARGASRPGLQIKSPKNLKLHLYSPKSTKTLLQLFNCHKYTQTLKQKQCQIVKHVCENKYDPKSHFCQHWSYPSDTVIVYGSLALQVRIRSGIVQFAQLTLL